MITFKTTKNSSHITDAHLTAASIGLGSGQFFPIVADGKLQNADEFIQYKMEQFGLKSAALIYKAVTKRGYDSIDQLRWS